MLAFKKFGQKYSRKTMHYIFMVGMFTLLGVFGTVALSWAKGPEILFKAKFVTHWLLQGSAALVFFLYLRRIFHAYMQALFFNEATLALVMSLAKLMMLFAIVIEPGCYFFIELVADDVEVQKAAGVVTYLAHMNIALFAAGYALHLISAAHKVARHIENEQNLTI